MTPREIANLLLEQVEPGDLGVTSYKYRIFTKGRQPAPAPTTDVSDALPDEDVWGSGSRVKTPVLEPRVILAHDIAEYRGMLYVGIDPGEVVLNGTAKYKAEDKPTGWYEMKNVSVQHYGRTLLRKVPVRKFKKMLTIRLSNVAKIEKINPEQPSA